MKITRRERVQAFGKGFEIGTTIMSMEEILEQLVYGVPREPIDVLEQCMLWKSRYGLKDCTPSDKTMRHARKRWMLSIRTPKGKSYTFSGTWAAWDIVTIDHAIKNLIEEEE